MNQLYVVFVHLLSMLKNKKNTVIYYIFVFDNANEPITTNQNHA